MRDQRRDTCRVRSGAEAIEGVLRSIELQLRAFFVAEWAIRAADELANASHLMRPTHLLPGCQRAP